MWQLTLDIFLDIFPFKLTIPSQCVFLFVTKSLFI